MRRMSLSASPGACGVRRNSNACKSISSRRRKCWRELLFGRIVFLTGGIFGLPGIFERESRRRENPSSSFGPWEEKSDQNGVFTVGAEGGCDAAVGNANRPAAHPDAPNVSPRNVRNILPRLLPAVSGNQTRLVRQGCRQTDWQGLLHVPDTRLSNLPRLERPGVPAKPSSMKRSSPSRLSIHNIIGEFSKIVNTINTAENNHNSSPEKKLCIFRFWISRKAENFESFTIFIPIRIFPHLKIQDQRPRNLFLLGRAPADRWVCGRIVPRGLPRWTSWGLPFGAGRSGSPRA